jgi:hypothetical protein
MFRDERVGLVRARHIGRMPVRIRILMGSMRRMCLMWLMRRMRRVRRMRRMRLKRLSDLKCLMRPMRLVRLVRLESLMPLVHRGRCDVPWCRPRRGMDPVHLAAGRAQRGGHRLQRQGDREDPDQQ